MSDSEFLVWPKPKAGFAKFTIGSDKKQDMQSE